MSRKLLQLDYKFAACNEFYTAHVFKVIICVSINIGWNVLFLLLHKKLKGLCITC